MRRAERLARVAAWRAADERGECTCVARALALGLVAERGDPVPIDPGCERHGWLLGQECDEHLV